MDGFNNVLIIKDQLKTDFGNIPTELSYIDPKLVCDGQNDVECSYTSVVHFNKCHSSVGIYVAVLTLRYFRRQQSITYGIQTNRKRPI